MSRSRRKTSACGMTCSESEKKDKRIANRTLRRKTKQQLDENDSNLNEVIFVDRLREVSDVWMMNKDGKQFFDSSTDYGQRLMRK